MAAHFRWTPWEEMAEVTEEAFHVWPPDFPERRWGQEAWWILTKVELTAPYEIDSSQSLVIARFLALAGMYLDFCKIAWGEERLPFYKEWAGLLGFNSELLEQICWDEWLHKASDEEIQAWLNSDYEGALLRLIDVERKVVRDALVDSYGGTKELFCSLWKSAPPEMRVVPGGRDPARLMQGVPLADSEIVERVIPKCPKPIYWIRDGCPRIL